MNSYVSAAKAGSNRVSLLFYSSKSLLLFVGSSYTKSIQTRKVGMRMYLNVTPAAQARLARYLSPQKKLILDFDDGVGPFSALGNCSLDVNFKLILVDQAMALPDFDAHFSSNIGEVYYKGYAKPQYAESMTLDFEATYFTLPLKSPHGLLSDNVEVVDLSTDSVAPTMLGTHDC